VTGKLSTLQQQNAIDFLFPACCDTAPQKRQADRAKQRAWQNDRVRYGKTDGGKYVDQHSLDQLVSLGYELPLAAEALRQVGWRWRCMEVCAFVHQMHVKGGWRLLAGSCCCACASY
jgi:hypothetical protein